MATKPLPNAKRTLIGKANTTIVATTSVASFLVIFSLVASQALFSQFNYQNRIIGAKKQALSQLKTDIDATNNLVNSYKAFVSTPQNVIGGNPSGNGPQDGDNAKIVLDALPSKYDFPALATSLEKMLTGKNIQIQGIGGTDDEVAQSTNQSSEDPTPVAIPFQISVNGDYQAIQSVISEFEASIRPFQVQTITLTGSDKNLSLSLTAQTFYQPEKDLKITTKAVK